MYPGLKMQACSIWDLSKTDPLREESKTGQRFSTLGLINRDLEINKQFP